MQTRLLEYIILQAHHRKEHTMKLKIAVIAPLTTRTVLRLMSQKHGTSILTSTVYESFTTTSLTLVPLFTAIYTIDTQGIIDVIDVWLDLITDNSANGTCTAEISGDGGATYIPMTTEIPSTTNLETRGPGLWITGINIGTNQLKIRIKGRSTDGALATIKIRNDSTMDIIFNKRLV